LTFARSCVILYSRGQGKDQKTREEKKMTKLEMTQEIFKGRTLVNETLEQYAKRHTKTDLERLLKRKQKES
jgi:hypothetical protein